MVRVAPSKPNNAQLLSLFQMSLVQANVPLVNNAVSLNVLQREMAIN